MKERFKEIGWMGWTALVLAVVLFVGAIVATNTTQSQPEVVRPSDSVSGNTEVKNVTEEEREVPAPVVAEEVVVEGDASGESAVAEASMPTTGAVGEEEFEYSFDWE